MNQGNPDSAPDAARLADAVAVARRLLGELVGTLEARGDPAAAAVVTTLAESRTVLTRLAGPDATPAPAAADGGADAAAADRATSLVLDVSDLIGYFATNRLPTGIQRVQTELIFNILKAGGDTGLCCFVEARDEWVTVNPAFFMSICAQSRSGGDPQEPRWLDAIRELNGQTAGAAAFAFRPGAVLVNVGTSWWLPNYFLYVRQAKRAAGLRYVPLIYDLIPILMPQNCDPELVREFIDWFIGVLEHADFFLAISEATKRDLIAIAARMGRPIAPERILVTPLDADFRIAAPAGAAAPRRFPEPFVLFVSTIEARKNQLGALDAWATLIARHGPARVPRLVLVGKRGFQSDRVLARLEANADLRERVTILSGIEDSELQALYRDCSFTIYPSVYEGWGLPITESLSHGKVALIADNSSLPEAGGTTALYFPTGSTGAMVTALERLILEAGYREGQEQVIRRDFRPRTWATISADVRARIAEWGAATPPAPWQPPVAEPGAYYRMVRNQATGIWPGMGSAEAFRYGLGWFRMEEHGCWTRQTGAEIALRLAHPGAARIALQLTCPPRAEARYDITIPGHVAAISGRLDNHRVKWAFLDIPETVGDAPFRIRIDTHILAQPDIGWNGDLRRLGMGLIGFFLFPDGPSARLDFVEAAALGALANFDAYRDRSAGGA